MIDRFSFLVATYELLTSLQVSPEVTRRNKGPVYISDTAISGCWCSELEVTKVHHKGLQLVLNTAEFHLEWPIKLVCRANLR